MAATPPLILPPPLGEGCREVFNEQFAKDPADADDAHRDGEIVLLYKGRELACKVYRQGEAPAAPVDAKRLPSVVDKVVARRRRGSGHKPAPDHPWRRWQGDPESAKPCQQ